jgi:hypothetical protein
MADANTHGLILSEFDNMRIKHDRLPQVYSVFDSLRRTTRDAPLQPKRWSCLFAPTHSGKSTAVCMYRETVVAKEAVARGLFRADMDPKEIARRQKIVLHITLEGVTKIKNLAQEILAALGGPTKGTTSDLLRLVYDYLGKLKVELLIIDELQHLMTDRIKKSSEGPNALTDTFKTMLIRGLVPIVFVGIDEARSVVFNDEQFGGRCVKEINFSCLDWTIPTERKLFEDYCGAVGLKLKQHGLFADRSNFMSRDLPACLHAAAGGRLGMVSRIVEQAALIAIDDGSSQVLREHLAAAVDRWAIPNKIVKYNPFRGGQNEAKLIEK